MPTPISELETAYLVENAGQSTSDYTDAQILDELKLRIVDDEDENEEMRGGIHPRRPL